MINEILKIDDYDQLYDIAIKENTFKHLDKKNSLKTLTKQKIKNLIISSIEEKELKTKVVSKPYIFIIDPVNACNLGCPLCPTGLNESKRIRGVMKIDFFKELIDEIKDYAVEVHLYNWGEPVLNKKLCEMLSYCHDNNIWTRISSNFSLKFKDGYIEKLITSGLSLLHIDLDGLDEKVYKKYRVRGDYNLVINNIKESVRIKKLYNLDTPIIELAMLAMRQNEHQLDEFLSMKDDLGVDYVQVDKIQHNPNMDEKWLPKNKDLIYSSYEGGKASSKSSTEKNINPCIWPWSGIVINWDGNVSPCCIVDDPESDFNNIKNVEISKIWNSEEYISSRSEFGDRKEITKETICNICKNETHSKRLNRVSTSFAIKL